jgi:hypothetical protein
MWNTRKHWCPALLLLSCLALTAGCKRQSNYTVRDKNISSGNDQKGYLYSDGEGVIFLQWTEINSKLNGQMNVFHAKGGRGKSTERFSHSFEGVSDGKNISLNFTGSPWTERLGGKTLTGTISESELTLVIPASSGALAPVKFNAGTVEQYNQAVLDIKQAVQSENKKTQKETADAAGILAEKNMVIEGNNRVKFSLDGLTDSINRLEALVKFDDVFSSYSTTWETMKADHNTLLKEAAERPLTSYQLGKVRYDLGTLRYDKGALEYHSRTLAYKVRQINDASNSVREGQKSLRNSWGLLQQAVAANSSGTPNGQFSESEISGPLHLADDQIRKASEEIQQASKRRASYHDLATELYRNAEAFVNSLRPTDLKS